MRIPYLARHNTLPDATVVSTSFHPESRHADVKITHLCPLVDCVTQMDLVPEPLQPRTIVTLSSSLLFWSVNDLILAWSIPALPEAEMWLKVRPLM